METMTSMECNQSGSEVVPRRWLTRLRFLEMIESVSRRALSGSSGSYHVRGAELARDRRLKTLSATVVFLDDTQHTFQLDKRAKGQALLDLVFQHLELIEKDYFGLQYAENGSVSTSSPNPDVMRWLDPSKLVKKQIRSKGGQFFFRVKFYVSDPSKLQEEYTRYQFYLQIRKDILQGKLQLLTNPACILASYIVQSELGDYHPEEHGPGYISRLQLIPGQTEEMERRISEYHQLHKGQLPADAEFNFLDHAKRLDMYGVELHKDSANKEIQLGVTSIGLVVFQNNTRINVFSWSKIVKISFKRKQFFIQLRREQSENYDTLLGFNMQTYRSSKNLWKSCVEHHTFFRLHSPKLRPRRFPLALSSRFTYSGRTEFQTVEDGKHRARVERTFIRSPSKKLIHGILPVPISEEKGKLLPPGRPTRSYDNKVQSLGAREPRQAWGEGNQSDDEGGFLSLREEVTITHTQGTGGAFSPMLGSRVLTYADEDTTVERNIYDIPDYSEPTSSPAPQVLEEGLVTIRITPDEQGRFGFNVKGGLDLDMPILVSRVAPNTPADRCYPKLNEGDQVVYINGRDVNGMLHEHVVNLIRQSRDSGTGELTLTVRPNALYNALAGTEEPLEEEPPYRYVPDVPHTAVGSDALAQSMLLLADGLASGALIAQYEQLYRKNPELTSLESKKPENQNKNRYRDISPYDVTRVILMGSNGDYINANYVNMEIPGSGIINRYIATQGPLSSTVADFWQMVLEAGSTLVVMLTTLVERGRAKCHQYWPALQETLTLRNLTLTCTSEINEDTFVFREFVLTDTNTGEERDITHMQYCAWPDHGVPGDWRQFTTFTEKVRAARTGIVEPAVVHCSAGIGRTGVLVLMETALCLIEANQPVYPLDIVRSMRDQRAMMIQNASQYRFVCEAVHKAYTEGIVKPLPEFSR
ncbi:tyrosine-protein phosphatase non-receptor type 4 isoform X2 [Nasonia vitripennis]|uniref:protein-tyrosine-phosphatase n=1 Tax=Nasonia vitripennis TaxID=7425 RepID=A0A7M7T6Z5_NASVI|nr:tyrosine-protein phosphatase non-receptor type 4 isoform X2 [Nasonia vitripennis]